MHQRVPQELQAFSGRDASLEEADWLRGEIDALRNRLTRMSEASLRINESLNLPHRPARGHRQRLFAHRGSLRRIGGLRRLRGNRDPHHLRHHPRRAPEVRGTARGSGTPPVPERDRGAAEIDGYRQPPQVGRLSQRPSADEDLPGNSRPLSGPASRQYLSHREGGRPGVHAGRRIDPCHVRLPGGTGHLQRTQVQRRASGQGRPRSPRGHLAGGRPGLRREDSTPAVAQSGDDSYRPRAARTWSQSPRATQP